MEIEQVAFHKEKTYDQFIMVYLLYFSCAV